MNMFGTVPVCLLIAIIPLSLCNRRQHHRRSLLYDGRFVGFRFETEPSDSLSTSRLLLDCGYVVEKANVRDIRLEWRKDNTPIKPGHSSHVAVHSNGSLSIPTLVSSDEGLYQCVVHVITQEGTSWTFLSRTATVRIPDLAKFEEQPSVLTVHKGHPAVFHCYTSMNPAPNVSWYRNNEIITNTDEYHVLPVSNSLEISSAQQRHEGEFHCVVEGAGKRRTSQGARLRISNESPISDGSLVFLSSPREQMVLEGQSFLLECLVAGSSVPEVRWLKDSRQVVVDGVRVRRVGVASVVVDKAVVEDAGLYTCRASTSDDSADRTVLVKINAKPHITTSPESKVALETTDVDLECLAAGRPTPDISWYKNGEKIIGSQYFVIEPNRLRILGLVKTDQGVYQCVADNLAGSQQASAQLLVDAADSSSVAASTGLPNLPTVPLDLTVSSYGSRIITLDWDPPLKAHGRIMRYQVFYREDNSDRERQLNASSTSLTVTGLLPDTLYVLRVAAENEAGLGKASDHVKVTTKKEQAVPGRVQNLVAEAVGPETIEVRWDPPVAGPEALRYKLFYIRNPPGDDKETQTMISSNRYTLHGMDKFTEYAIRVEAEGENGSGLTTDPIIVRTLSDAPGSPPRDIHVEAVSSTSVRVAWKDPYDERNGELTGYRLKYKTKLRGSKGNQYMIDATEKEYTVSGLEPGTQYLFRLAAVNHNGTGPFSDWIRTDTPLQDKEEALLGAPRELRPQAGTDYILLSWLPPADESIIVRGYQVGWGHNVPDVSVERVQGNVLHHKIVGLKPARDYVISLRASNRQGLGFPIYETVRTLSHSAAWASDGVLESDPAATPLGVRAETTSETSIRVVWTEADPTAFNTMYTVRYTSSADGNVMRTHNATEPWLLVEGLRPAVEYEFAVRATSAVGGVSQWSMAARNRTLPAAPSSAPRDLTVLPAASGDPHSVSLNWQPPKYGNGEIEEYIIYYTDRPSLPDKDWTINYVPGDKLSYHVSNLLPRASYSFKIQARNEKGYSPLSQPQVFLPAGGTRQGSVQRPSVHQSGGELSELIALLKSNPLYLTVLAVLILIILLLIVLVVICVARRSSTPKRGGYVAGKKTSSQAGAGADLWIAHPGGSQVRAGPSQDYGLCAATEMKHLTGPEVVESPPPRYQALQGQGTLSRSYHQSSSSLEAQRQRTPQVVYTGGGRHQPIARVDLDSPYGSSSALNSATPPLPSQAPPSGPPMVDGYRTLRGTPPTANALRSFSQMAAGPPSGSGGPRPVVIAAPGTRHVPVGRATAQPRVNVANIYSPYSACSSDNGDVVDKKSSIQADIELQPTSNSQQNLQPSESTEELNLQMESLDNMIDDLQNMQHEFGGGGLKT